MSTITTKRPGTAASTRRRSGVYVPQKPRPVVVHVDAGKAWDCWVAASERSREARQFWNANEECMSAEAKFLRAVNEAAQAWEQVKASRSFAADPEGADDDE